MANEIEKRNETFLIYQDENGIARVNVRFEGEDVWLTVEQIMELFDASQQDVSYHIKQIYANGALDDDDTKAIRQKLIENDKVEAIIVLPRNMFYSTDISVTLWILNNNKKARTVEQNGKMVRYRNREDEVLFIDLRQWGEPFEKKYIQFSTEQIQQIAENFHNWQRVGYEETYHNEPEYCYSATLKEIEKKGWSLVPSKYIEFRNRDEQIDFDTKMKQLQAEMTDLLKQEEESKQQLKELFGKLGYGI